MNLRNLLNAFPIFIVLVLATGCPARKAEVYRQTPIAISASDLAQAFKDEDKGIEKYTGKIVKVTGVAQSLGEDSSGAPFVQIRGAGDTDLQCFFAKSAYEQGAKIQKGQTVTLQGICANKVIYLAVTECVFPS